MMDINKQAPLHCGSCKADFTLTYHSDEPAIFRYCPICGERSMMWDNDRRTDDAKH